MAIISGVLSSDASGLLQARTAGGLPCGANKQAGLRFGQMWARSLRFSAIGARHRMRRHQRATTNAKIKPLAGAVNTRDARSDYIFASLLGMLGW